MIHDYDNPTTCYAIGDSFAAYMGTATTTRQPSSGVFEEISAIVKPSGSDGLFLYNGSANVRFADYNIITGALIGHSTAAPPLNYYNLSLKIGNTVYIQKTGTTDRLAVTGVQVDA